MAKSSQIWDLTNLLLDQVDGLAAFTAFGQGDGGEAALVIADNHLVAVLGALAGGAGDGLGVGRLLEVRQEGLSIRDAKDLGFLFLDAFLLDLAEFLDELGGLDGLAAGRAVELVGSAHQVAGQGALAGASQVGDLVAGGGAAQTAETTAVDGGAGDDDLLGVASDADHVGGRVDFDEVVRGAADLGDDLVLGVLDGVDVLGQLHAVDLDLLLLSIDFDDFLVQQDGDDLSME